MTTTRFTAWLKAFDAERRACAELHAAFNDNDGSRRARRRLGRANLAHCKALRREVAARQRLSRQDHDQAIASATAATT